MAHLDWPSKKSERVRSRGGTGFAFAAQPHTPATGLSSSLSPTANIGIGTVLANATCLRSAAAMQYAPVSPDDHTFWSSVSLGRANRDLIKAQLLVPGPYTPDDDAVISDALLVIDRLSDNKDKKITRTKHETYTPLRSAYMCHDSKLHITYGKVSCTVHRASALDLTAFLFDYESVYNDIQCRPPTKLNDIESRALERTNSHHQVIYYHGRLPPPPMSGGFSCWHSDSSFDFVSSFIIKRLADKQYLCVVFPALHKDMPVKSDVVRAESTRIYLITNISESVTKLELFATIDLRGAVPSLITSSIVIPASLQVSSLLYFMHIKDYDDYDAAGEDAKNLGQLLMDETRSLSGEARNVVIHTFFSCTAALCYLERKHVWFEAMISCIIENKKVLLPATTSSSSRTSTAVLPKAESIAGAARSARRTMTAMGSRLASALAAAQKSHASSLKTVTEADAIKIGRSFALLLLSSITPEEAVDEFILSEKALSASWIGAKPSSVRS